MSARTQINRQNSFPQQGASDSLLTVGTLLFLLFAITDSHVFLGATVVMGLCYLLSNEE